MLDYSKAARSFYLSSARLADSSARGKTNGVTRDHNAKRYNRRSLRQPTPSPGAVLRDAELAPSLRRSPRAERASIVKHLASHRRAA